MSPPLKFPGPLFAWAFCSVLLAVLAVASYEDLKRMVIPKWVTLPMLFLGVVFNMLRGGWVEGTGWGAWNGFLTSLGGFGTGFGLFLLMWLLGTCGGGDVKLFAALGAWTGPLLAIYILIGTLVLVVVLSVSKVALALLSGKPRLALQLAAPPVGRAGGRSGSGSGPPVRTPRQRLMTYSLPVALSTACVLLWVFRSELRLVPERQDAADQAQVQARL